LSGWLVCREAGTAGAALTLGVYAVQLLLNAAWTPIFFGFDRLGLAVIEIISGLQFLQRLFFFSPISAVAAYLLVPYLARVTFASALNFAIWRGCCAALRLHNRSGSRGKVGLTSPIWSGRQYSEFSYEA
jgi:tryptophan-rich sensory protein